MFEIKTQTEETLRKPHEKQKSILQKPNYKNKSK